MPKDSEENYQRLILKGDEKAKFEIPTSEVWQSFNFNLIDEGPTTKVFITCLQCKESLEAMANDQFPEHKCLDKDGRLTAKTMPTRSETVNMIKAKVGAKINTGVYKLRVNGNDLKGNVWKIFTLIARASDDVIVDGCFYCTKCNIVQVSRLHSRALSSHKCMHGLHQSKISIKYVQRQIDTGIYKVIHNDELINPLWKVFSFIAKRNGSNIVTGVVFCRYCEIVLEFNDGNEEQLKQHKCYKDYGAQQKRNNNHAKSQSEAAKADWNPITKADVGDKIAQGIYKLKMKSDDDQSIIWKIIATILKPDGCLIDGYVYCTKCKLVLSHKFTSLSSYIYRHKCILDLQLNSGQNDAENCSKRRKLNAQEDNVIVLCDDSTNESLPLENSLNKQNECIYPNDKTLWSRFEKIAMHDGSTLKGVVSCRQCKMMLNYDGITEINLNSHTCFSMASVSCSGSTDDVDCLNLEKPIEIKTETNMNAEAALGSNQKEFISNFNETTQIKQEPTDLYVKENSFKDLDHSFIKEEDNSDLDSCEFLLEDNTICKVKQEFINIQTKSIAKKDYIQGNSLGLLDLNKLINHWLAVEMKYDENVKTSDSESLITSIEEMLALNKTEIKLILKENSKNLSISLDFWYEKLTNNNYLLATLYRQRNNELSNLVLGIKPINCSSPNAKPDIRKILKTLLREFDLDHLTDIVFVSEHNEDTEKALDDDSKSITILKCSNHLFKNVLDSALENTKNLDELIETMKVIVKYLKSSEQEEGEKHLRNLPEFPCKSYYSLLKTLAVNWSKVNAVLANKTEILKINDDVSKTLESLVKLCEKFEYIFKRLRAAQSPSLCFVIPSIQRLRIMCSSTTAKANDDEVIKSFKMNLLQNIQEIWESHITIWHRAACFLYPPANKEQQEFLTEIKRFCITKMMELKTIDSPNKAFETRACNTNNNDDDANDMDFFFPNLFRRIEPQQLTSDNVEEEVNSYSEESVVMCKNFNALQWWNNHTTKYPRLSRVALQILTIPACTGKSTCVQLF